MDSRRPKYAAVGNARAQKLAAAAERKTQQWWWRDTRSSVDAQLTTMRVEVAQQRAEKDIKKAEHPAELGERDAADAIE